MHSLLIALWTLLSIGAAVAPQDAAKSPTPMTLFDFDGAEMGRWKVVNDGVMGGRSKGTVEIESDVLRFSGTLVTRGGGFTSVRVDRPIDLTGYEGLELRVRGGGRTFEVEVDDGTRRWRRSVSRRAAFATAAEWTLVRVPFDALETSVFGQPVAARPLDLSNVRSFGLYILDGIDGPFRLEIDVIRAYAGQNRSDSGASERAGRAHTPVASGTRHSRSG